MNANSRHDANAVASNVDNTIDRALSALRDAQPRSGLEGRILASLETRTIAPQPTRLHLSAHLALWAATSAAIIAVASLVILHHHAVERTTQAVLSGASHGGAKSKGPDTARLATNSEPFSTTNLAQTSIEPTHRMAHRSAMPVSCAQPGCPVHDGGDAVVMNGASTTPTDAQLLADLHAPSRPAPPIPLTSEEKLFLHALRYGNLTQLAELNPEVRAQRDADETKSFKAFFPDPPPLKQPGDTE